MAGFRAGEEMLPLAALRPVAEPVAALEEAEWQVALPASKERALPAHGQR